jgi:malate dehydrogenase (oxaloacetate-decarboxylating)(NADP+)
MKPVFDMARSTQRRVVFAEGENPKIMQAVDNIVQEQLCFPIVLGREEVIKSIIKDFGLTAQPGKDFEIMEYEENEQWWRTFHGYTERRGKTLSEAREILRNSKTTQAAMMVKLGLADSMITGTIGRFHRHLGRILSVSQQDDGFEEVSALSIIISTKFTLFIADTHVTAEPTAKAIADMTVLAAKEVARFGLKPKAALLSHSSFGNRETGSSLKMREALALINKLEPELMVEGEMQADLALRPALRAEQFPNSNLDGVANLLMMPNLDAAHIAMNLIKTGADGVPIGPILLGCDIAAHIVTPGTTVRGLINMTAIAAARIVAEAK